MSSGKRGKGTRAPIIGTNPGDPLVTCTKASYENEETARGVARGRRRISGKPITAYKCPHGDHWHVGRANKGKRAR